MRGLADLIAPVACLSCGAPADGELCAGCAHRVDVLSPPWCGRCGTPGDGSRRCVVCAGLGGFDRARSLLRYAAPASRVVVALKRRGRRGLARDVGGPLADLAVREFAPDRGALVVGVPAGRHARRKGFDHADLLAREIASRLGLRRSRCLVRAREGPRQADLPLSERRRNAAGRFAARAVVGHVLVIDDVFTTGATAEAAASVLREAGAERVDVLTLARTARLRG